MIITDNPAVNKISFERCPRSERGPGCARAARQNGLLNEAFLARPRAARSSGPHLPQGPLSKEILLVAQVIGNAFSPFGLKDVQGSTNQSAASLKWP